MLIALRLIIFKVLILLILNSVVVLFLHFLCKKHIILIFTLNHIWCIIITKKQTKERLTKMTQKINKDDIVKHYFVNEDSYLSVISATLSNWMKLLLKLKRITQPNLSDALHEVQLLKSNDINEIIAYALDHDPELNTFLHKHFSVQEITNLSTFLDMYARDEIPDDTTFWIDEDLVKLLMQLSAKQEQIILRNLARVV